MTCIDPKLDHTTALPAGPFSLPLQCLARSGCLVSNILTSGNTLNVSASINAVSLGEPGSTQSPYQGSVWQAVVKRKAAKHTMSIQQSPLADVG
jgi:hypothetical protein